MPLCQSRKQSGASATPVLTPNADDRDDFADVDDNNSGVGFDSTTVLLCGSAHQPANKPADGPSGGSSTSGGNTGASPYTMFEPAYAQQQQGVLGSVLPDEKAVAAAGWCGGSVFPAPDASYSQPLPRLLPPPYVNTASARPPFTAGSLGILGSGTTVEGVSAPPSASAYSPSTTAAESATGAPVNVAASTDVLEVPLHAPRLRVPTNLPLEQTTLLDLLATAVVQGGPTTEEEIVKREMGRGNPAFAFLGEKFNHPCMLYYRWRLYSLLQGDTLVSWRTQPFQIEEARRAYVWVPPPPLKVGPECLVGLHQPELLDPAFATGSGGDAAATVGGAEEEDGADVIETTKAKSQPLGQSPAGTSAEAPSSEAAADAAHVRLPPPSAQWISRQCTAHRHVFAILQPHLLEKWTALLNPYAMADPATTGDGGIAALCERWLRRDEIASRMAFAIRHADAMHHLLSVLLDAVVKVAYVATARSRQQPTASVDLIDSNVYCVEALWYLFVLHDIVMNASNTPEPSATSATSVNKNVSNRQQPQQVLSTAAGMSGATLAGRIGLDEELFASEGSPEALEALYEVFRRQHMAIRAGASTPPSPAAAAGTSSATATAVSPSSALGSTPRPRRRQRHPQRRSPYERCGDALEMILPTLMEACTAIALAVSMDKERQRSQAAETAPTAAARVRHFKVLPPQQQQQSKAKGKSKASEHESAMTSSSTTLPVGGGPALSLRLDAGCDAASVAKTPSSTLPLSSPSAEGSGCTSAGGGADTAAPSTSSAPAVMLLHWLKGFLLVWMNAEQPLQLPPSPSPSAGAGMAAGAVLPPGTVWPDCQADAADMPDVSLTYHVDPQNASLLGLDAASQQQRNVYHQPPLLSARACAILKDRYSFLF
ncbi:Surp module family protein [Leishmania donovani]|uniref:Surp module family protein n=1 Tax=Leishmania donovani TaxID=5661 RepID=A0A504Y0K0_LEIDO|nr:Surp module family protein [Leishmania donovani]